MITWAVTVASKAVVSTARDAMTLPVALPTSWGPSSDVGEGLPNQVSTGSMTIAYQPSPVPGCKEWSSIVDRVRRGGGTLFWELFAGVAVLTTAFAREGWATGPPVDVITSPITDLLNPAFVMLVLGLILEGHITVLHLGPPCSSFSMAVNRFLSQRIRSRENPEGLGGLRPDQQEKVIVGNHLAEISITLARAQMRVRRFFQLEQPASSLMLQLPSFRKLLADPSVHLAARCVCVDGAP